MAAQWQKWMPFHIDRFRGSLHVQGMPAAAKIGYLYLLSAQWQSDDCSLPDDDFELQILSGLTHEEWTRLGALILRRFHKREDGRLSNAALADEWSKTKATWDKRESEREELRRIRSEAGKKGAAIRHTNVDQPSKSLANANKSLANAKESLANANNSLANARQTPAHAQAKPSFNRTEQNSTKKDLKPSRDDVASDPRHVPFRTACEAYAAFKRVTFVWNGSDAKALGELLKAAPHMTLDDFKHCLNHRAKSAGIAHGDRPRVYLPTITRYQEGPLNEFGKTGGTNGHHGKTGHSIDAAQQAIDELAERARAAMEAGADYPLALESGHQEASQAR